jgi:hypothetical protein
VEKSLFELDMNLLATIFFKVSDERIRWIWSRGKKYLFSQATYLSQVKQLRLLAKEAIGRYDIRLQKLDFIQLLVLKS